MVLSMLNYLHYGRNVDFCQYIVALPLSFVGYILVRLCFACLMAEVVIRIF